MTRPAGRPPNSDKLVTMSYYTHIHIIACRPYRTCCKCLIRDCTHFVVCIVALCFPDDGSEVTYRQNAKEVSDMLRAKHTDKYAVSLYCVWGIISKYLTIFCYWKKRINICFCSYCIVKAAIGSLISLAKLLLEQFLNWGQKKIAAGCLNPMLVLETFATEKSKLSKNW